MIIIHKGHKIQYANIPQYIANQNKGNWEEWEKDLFEFLGDWLAGRKKFELQTSGSTGNPKKITVDREDLLKSARYTLNFLRLTEGNQALLCLPVRFIAGKMMVVRAITGNLTLECIKPASDPLVEALDDALFTAITPHQLETILTDSSSTEKLKSVDKVIVGGSGLSEDLLKEINTWKNEVYHTYGMTETLSHVAMARLTGKKADFRLFQRISEEFLFSSEEGRLKVITPYTHASRLVTNDLVDLIDEGSFRWLGRADNAVNSGGIKIIPELVEQKLIRHIDVPFFLAGKTDDRFGEKLVICILEESQSEFPESKLNDICEMAIEDPVQRPREVIYLKQFQYTENNKIKRQESLKNG